MKLNFLRWGGWEHPSLLVLAISIALLPRAEAQSQYDLRAVSVGGSSVAWVPAIQNQGSAEDCWTFASATAMNSNLLMQGLLPTSTIAPPIQLSSWHLSTTNGAPDQLDASKAFSNNSNWGGYEYMNLGYVSRGAGSWQVPNVPHHDVDPGNYVQTLGGGPVLISNNALNVFPKSITDSSGYPENLTPLLPPAQQPIAYQVKTMVLLDQGYSTNVALPTSTGTYSSGGLTYSTYAFTQGAADLQVQAVKAAIQTYGAVTTSMNASNQSTSFKTDGVNPLTGLNVNVYQNNTTATAFTDHEVTLIGWDDSYVIHNSLLDVTTTGAWLVQNSWGSTGPNGWNNSDGTFWAAYDDASIGRLGVSAYELRSNAPFSSIVIQNELGPMDYTSNYPAVGGNESAWAASPTGMATATEHIVASILTPTTNGYLSALGVAIQKTNVEIRLDIYGAWLDGPDSSTLLLGNQIYELNGIGYHVIDLSEKILLTANNGIVIQLTYLDATTHLALENAIPIVIGDGGLHGDYLNVPDNLSFFLSGENWVDFSTLSFTDYDGNPSAQGGVLFLKGIMAIPEPGTGGLLLIGFGFALWKSRKTANPHLTGKSRTTR